ncbi:hypothetical protein BGZ99_007876, partial [Dissophora globulifera]
SGATATSTAGYDASTSATNQAAIDGVVKFEEETERIRSASSSEAWPARAATDATAVLTITPSAGVPPAARYPDLKALLAHRRGRKISVLPRRILELKVKVQPQLLP